MHPLHVAIENLALAIEAEEHPDDLAIWAVAALAHRFHITIALSDSREPVEALKEIGDQWADNVIEMLDEQPDRQGETNRVAEGVVRRLTESGLIECTPS